MKKCPKCSEYIYSQLVVCNKCGMPMLVQPPEIIFPAPSEFINLLRKQQEAKIKETKPIPLFDDDDTLKSLSADEVYGEDVDIPSSSVPDIKEIIEKKSALENKKTAYKTISIPLLKDKKFEKRRTSIVELELDEESEELIVADFDEEVEDLGYEPEIVNVPEVITEQEADSDVDFDLEYMPLPGDQKENKVNHHQKEKEKIEIENKDLQRLTKIKQSKLNIEYIPDYPDSWEWVIFDNDSENKIGYQISGREKDKAKFDFLIFPDENISEDVMTKISEDQKDQLKMLLKQGKIMESIRSLRKNFRALPFRQAEKIIKGFARQEKFKVQDLNMAVDLLPAKDKKVILRILQQGKTLEAIYLFRSMTKLDLKASREQIEYLCEKEKLNYDPMQVTTENIMIKRKKKGGFLRFIIFALVIYALWTLFF